VAYNQYKTFYFKDMVHLKACNDPFRLGFDLSAMNTRLKYPDALRALAIIAIVFLHVSSPIAQDFSGYPLGWWWIANIFFSCTRPSIALFVMISGGQSA
jgi:hypothetical protein